MFNLIIRESSVHLWTHRPLQSLNNKIIEQSTSKTFRTSSKKTICFENLVQEEHCELLLHFCPVSKDEWVSRWWSHYHSTSEPWHRTLNEVALPVLAFVWPLDYFLKWSHQKAMSRGGNRGHMSRESILFWPGMIETSTLLGLMVKKKSLFQFPTKEKFCCIPQNCFFIRNVQNPRGVFLFSFIAVSRMALFPLHFLIQKSN